MAGAPSVPVPSLVELPDAVDVAVIGAGYTGLAAARALAGGGASVLVLERETVGAGASSRNGGMVLPGYKADLPDLVARLGLERARALWQESLEAIAFVERLIAEEGIACEWRRARARDPRGQARPPAGARGRDAGCWPEDFDYPTELLGPAEIGREIGSTRYHGGLVDPLAGALQPAAYVAGLAAAALRAGARIAEHTTVTGLARRGEADADRDHPRHGGRG